MKEEEKVTMEVTKDEAMFILYDRLENKWYVDLEPVFIFVPGMVISYFAYELVSTKYNDWWGLLTAAPVIALCVLLLSRQMKKRRIKAEQLYKEMKG